MATRHEICCPNLISSEIMWANMSISILQNLDDETSGALNGGAAPVLHAEDGHRGMNELESSSHEPLHANISREESFVSPAMYV